MKLFENIEIETEGEEIDNEFINEKTTIRYGN